MNPQDLDLTACDHEPIHIPSAIQPHGLMLVADAAGTVRFAAGDVEGRLSETWRGRALADLLGIDLALGLMNGTAVADLVVGDETLNVSAQKSGEWLLIELEPAEAVRATAGEVLGRLEAAAGSFEAAPNLKALCEQAAAEFARLTGYERVMVYRFLEDGAGVVMAEERVEGLPGFLNHHFPATDIPKQARALYVRNRVRVIPDISYTPAPLRPDWTDTTPLDMSDASLRSVSPVHLRYLANMGVGASASVSIIKDGDLWGLIACHNGTPRTISFETRAACRALASSLGRQIKTREETEIYRERIRLRGYEDDIVQLLSRKGSLDEALSNHLGDVRKMLDGDGVAVVRGNDLITSGNCPSQKQILKLAEWLISQPAAPIFSSRHLSEVYPEAQLYAAAASGLLSVVLSLEEPWVLMWFRAEAMQVVEWAGNPHKTDVSEAGTLTPRTSFEAWRETVRGQARRWSLPEIEAAGRLRNAVLEVKQNRRMRQLNHELGDALRDKDLLLQQKQFLIGEVNHRVQNSLQLVSSFLSMQARNSDDSSLQAALEEARRRLAAVSLVHRRLYRADQIEAVDAARYIEELTGDMLASMGEEWADHLRLDLSPVMISADRAVTIGLVVTELVINANKYAYRGASGPITISMSEGRGSLRLIVSDSGVGRTGGKAGFGSRMIEAMVGQLRGELVYENGNPGSRAVLTAPITPA